MEKRKVRGFAEPTKTGKKSDEKMLKKIRFLVDPVYFFGEKELQELRKLVGY